MADDSELNANILTTTEDAFEQFQSVSMYHEDEYITLSDIMPQNTKNFSEFSQIPYDNEVVLSMSDIVEEINKDTTGQIEQPQSQDPSISNLAPNKNLNVEKSYEHDATTQQPKKRGRKKKNHVENPATALKNDKNPDTVETIINNENNVTETLNVHNNQSALQNMPRRRGRPPKRFINPKNISTESMVTIQTNMSSESTSLLTSDVENSNPVYQNLGCGGRRRPVRPKKISSSQMLSAADSTTSDLMPSSEVTSSEDGQPGYYSLNDDNDMSSKSQQQGRKASSEISQQGTCQIYNEPKNISDNGPAPSSNKSPSKRLKRKPEEPSSDDILQMDLDTLIKSPNESVKMSATLTSDYKSDALTEISVGSDTNVDGVSNSINITPKKVKRGRPKKVPVELTEKLELIEEIASNKMKENQEDEDETDNMCLSKLKETYQTQPESIEQNDTINNSTPLKNNENEVPVKRNTKMPIMSDFEYNIDSIVRNDETNTDQSLLTEDLTKRPIRRKVKQMLHYDEGSDEDPFANVESSDDESKNYRKGNRYYSDDEYHPRSKKGKNIDTSDSELSDKSKKQKKKKICKKSENNSPRKRGKKSDKSLDSQQVDDIEEVLQSSVITTGDDSAKPLQTWGSSSEFENFLAKKIQGKDLKIKKVSSTESSENNVAPLEIPVIVPEAKQTTEISCQTQSVITASTAIQTTTPFDIPMKENINLTKEQSEKACSFLNCIVQTTAELGQLMTQKSEDFIKKKIHTEHVTDTFKMDYCVKKSFLLFKLAKHNLMQMEEDLAKQYEQFLENNNLASCREKPKELSGKPNDGSDSDCEFVEEIAPSKKSREKPKFNPKTVFLNKELSIKIAKKPNETQSTSQKKINIKGRHTVWINDTVMVKKVKPTQSFLAQDSRNKKPPDTFVTTEMVSDFFKNYYRQRALNICAPFLSTEWRVVNRETVCNYFVVKSAEVNIGDNCSASDGFDVTNAAARNSIHVTNNLNIIKSVPMTASPEPLSRLCLQILKNLLLLNCLKEINHHQSDLLTVGKKQPQKLLSICLRALTYKSIIKLDPELTSTKRMACSNAPITAFTLKNLCYRAILNLYFNLNETNQVIHTNNQTNSNYDNTLNVSKNISPTTDSTKNEIKSLFSLCVEAIQFIQYNANKNHMQIFVPNTLKHIAFENIKLLLNKRSGNSIGDEIPIGGLTINSVNTLSEEAFLNLEKSNDNQDNSDYVNDFENEDSQVYDDSNVDHHLENPLEAALTETNWVSQVQLQGFRSYSDSSKIGENSNAVNKSIIKIKLEPLEEQIETLAVVKTELTTGLDEMTIIPDFDDIKPEVVDDLNPHVIQRQNSNSYDIDAFENFVHSNKLMYAGENSSDDIFSQSSSRIHRQHEPDFDEDNDDMGLLIPQTYEPLPIENAKGSLMESSSDESSKNKKAPSKKKIEKRKSKIRRTNKNVSISTKDKVSNADVATLTRRMRDRIRQEEKKDESSESETENMSRVLRNKKEISEKPIATQTKNVSDTEIQCNNVDSTEIIADDITENFPGFTAIDQNETASYQKLMKYVYDKIVPNVEKDAPQAIQQRKSNSTNNNRGEAISPIFKPNEPVELLECEPAMPIFVNNEPKTHKRVENESLNFSSKKTEITKETCTFIDRHGWNCYPVNKNDSKLYQTACVSLEKLPESFVETYFRYQVITNKTKEDEEVDRLTNLNTLNRLSYLKETKTKVKSNRETKSDRILEHTPEAESCQPAVASDLINELTPSEDEGGNAEENLPLVVVSKHTENTLAKNSLMNDNESDFESGIKLEPQDDVTSKPRVSKTKCKVSPAKVDNVDPESLMLTADKVMNKELTLLHAPVVLNQNVKDVSSKKPNTRSKQKSAAKNQSTKEQIKPEDDSSSEEEKQWVTTKEKLLKRLEKKENTSADDAKRAKLVSEFIERRGDKLEAYKRFRNKPGRSRKKYFERQKQLKVLSRELFGEHFADGAHSKRKAQAYFKGRRNIRKVIDKKSLARSTVIANMEEFERKRRLNARQTQLRELLGCEEGVNVLVINDEVCLEYDFDEDRPVVTIHPFFTKVMKAHQYEGVKFMWDACFESLAQIASGHPGGGCILAHCMGLGKTLQVLALLHTVLTHPQVGMRRVLVCCPLSTVLNWVDEIHKWIGPVTTAIKVFELSKLKKTYERAYQLEDWYNGGGIFIIGYELFRSLSTLDPFLDDVRPTIINKIRTALLNPGPDIIVCDEGHLLKNDCSVLAVAMSRVVTKRRIVLTGTPMQNNLREYYCMVDFVKPNLLGTYAEYSNRFENPIMNGQHRDSQDEDIKLMKARTHILHKVLEGCLQRQEASVLYPYLPKKHEYTVFIPLTKIQWDMYKHYMEHYSKQAKQSILKDFHILHKIWSHPQVLHIFQTKAQDEKIKKERLEDDLATEDQEDIKPNATETWWLQYLEGGKMLDSLDCSNKFMVVFQILNECIALGDKILIFSTSLFCLDVLEYFLKKNNSWSLGQEYFRLDGSVPAEVRQKWCREFNADNNEKTKLFLVSTRAGCLGLNMTAANRVIILDTSWNPAHDIQSIFRVYRFGQKKDCYIYRLVAMGTMEQKIYERSVTKQAVACRVVDEQQIDRHYNSTDLTELYRYDESGSSVECGVAVSVQDVVLLRVARASALHAVHEHDSLLRGSEPALPEHERDAAWNQFQQEQEDKHVQNKLVSIPKIPLKRIKHPTNRIAQPPIKEIKDEDKSNNYIAPWERKSRKGKKTEDKSNACHSRPNILRGRTRNRLKNVEEPTEILGINNDYTQPGTSIGTEVDAIRLKSWDHPSMSEPEEDHMVQKITDILIKHNFQNRKIDVGYLIHQVKCLVEKDQWKSSDAPDELSRSIAEVLLGQEKVAKSPVNNPNMSESTTSFTATESSKEKITGDLGHEQITECVTPLVNRNVIDLDDDNDICADTDYIPQTNEEVGVINAPTKKKSSLRHRHNDIDANTESVSETTEEAEEINVPTKKGRPLCRRRKDIDSDTNYIPGTSEMVRELRVPTKKGGPLRYRRNDVDVDTNYIPETSEILGKISVSTNKGGPLRYRRNDVDVDTDYIPETSEILGKISVSTKKGRPLRYRRNDVDVDTDCIPETSEILGKISASTNKGGPLRYRRNDVDVDTDYIPETSEIVGKISVSTNKGRPLRYRRNDVDVDTDYMPETSEILGKISASTNKSGPLRCRRNDVDVDTDYIPETSEILGKISPSTNKGGPLRYRRNDVDVDTDYIPETSEILGKISPSTNKGGPLRYRRNDVDVDTDYIPETSESLGKISVSTNKGGPLRYLHNEADVDTDYIPETSEIVGKISASTNKGGPLRYRRNDIDVDTNYIPETSEILGKISVSTNKGGPLRYRRNDVDVDTDYIPETSDILGKISASTNKGRPLRYRRNNTDTDTNCIPETTEVVEEISVPTKKSLPLRHRHNDVDNDTISIPETTKVFEERSVPTKQVQPLRHRRNDVDNDTICITEPTKVVEERSVPTQKGGPLRYRRNNNTDNGTDYKPETIDVVEEINVSTKITSKESETNILNPPKKVKLSKPSFESITSEINEVRNVSKTVDVQEDSILLSDDEEPPAAEQANAKFIDTSEENEIVPLPISLLTNKNFIKIVAHTYSAGNPMLDEDAATLAAQYSTFRALKETEQSGKPIVSGSIYDIAVDVLGLPTLRKLHMVNDNMQKTIKVTAALQSKENDQALEVNVAGQSTTKVTNTNPNARVEPPKLAKTPQYREALVQPSVTITASTNNRVNTVAAPSACNVVPVGLIKRGPRILPSRTYMPQPSPSRDECILPDDDDVRLITDSRSPTPQPLAPDPSTPISPSRKVPSSGNKSVILNKLLSAPRKDLKFNQSERPVIQIARGQILKPNETSGLNLNQSASGDTICLDSDEDETIIPNAVNRAATAPAAAAQGAPAVAPVSPAPGAQLQASSIQTVLENRLSKGSQRKFVLVPASQVPFSIRNSAQEKMKPTAANRQSVPQNIAAPTAQPAPAESISPNRACDVSAPGAVCRPSDIVILSNSNQIKVLSKNDEKAAGKANVSVANVGLLKKSEKGYSAAPAVQQAPDAATPTEINSTSSSSSSRSSSPDNPLSILKDVVHIQANYDDASTSSAPNNYKKGLTKLEKCRKSNMALQHVVSVGSKFKTQKPASRDTTSSSSNVMRLGGDPGKTASDKGAGTSDKCGKKSPFIGRNDVCTYPQDKKPNSSKQITNSVSAVKKYTSQVIANRSTAVEGRNKRVGATAAALPALDTNSTKTIQTTNIKRIPSGTQFKTQSKKRPAVETTSDAAKRKKIPMTLKDFDIDDIDDIIELE